MAKKEFESQLEKLKEMAEKIKDEDTSLEESIECFEKGMEYYEKCDGILKNAEQRIETIRTSGSDE